VKRLDGRIEIDGDRDALGLGGWMHGLDRPAHDA